jgi:hypothetical protein
MLYSHPAMMGDAALKMKRAVESRPSVVAAVPSLTMSIAAAVRIGWSLYRNNPSAASRPNIIGRLSP